MASHAHRQFEGGIEIDIKLSGVETKRLQGEVSVSAFSA